MCKEAAKKSNTKRIKRIYDLAQEHWGDVKFVGLKYDKHDGWTAKVSFEKGAKPEYFKAHAEDPTDALKKLKNNVKRSIKRYMTV